jgi:hypothetical protein
MPFLTSPKHPASRLFTTLGGAENPLDDGTIHARSCAEHAAKIKKGSRIFIFTEPHTATRWRGLKFPPALNLLIFQILGGVGDTFAAGKQLFAGGILICWERDSSPEVCRRLRATIYRR